MKQNKEITVNPETIEEMDPVAVKAAVLRRCNAAVRHKPAHIILNAALILAGAFVLMSVFAFATTASRYNNDTTAVVTELPSKQSNITLVIANDADPWLITDDEKDMVAHVVTAVARGETALTQQAVAQAIRNSCEDFGLTVQEVIAEYQWPVSTDEEVSDITRGAVDRIVNGNYAVDASIHYAYNPDVQSGDWHEDNTFVCQIGSLRFFA